MSVHRDNGLRNPSESKRGLAAAAATSFVRNVASTANAEFGTYIFRNGVELFAHSFSSLFSRFSLKPGRNWRKLAIGVHAIGEIIEKSGIFLDSHFQHFQRNPRFEGKSITQNSAAELLLWQLWQLWRQQ